MKTYNPKERFCYLCGDLILTHNPGEYAWKRRDYRRESETYGRTLWFCCRTCANKYDEAYPRKHYRRMGG